MNMDTHNLAAKKPSLHMSVSYVLHSRCLTLLSSSLPEDSIWVEDVNMGFRIGHL